jgi:simple sugar transport system ATP-binding protein
LNQHVPAGSASSGAAGAAVAEAERISKSFGMTRALDNVSVDVRAGECHALVGRNGAGKSTLVSVLTGLTRPDQGEVRLQGQPAPALGDRAAWQQRVACVYQHSKIIPMLTVAENLFLNRFDRRVISWRRLRATAQQVIDDWGFDLDVGLLAQKLTVEQRQIVEIARALSIGSRFLILDEPTAALEARAAERLFSHVRRLNGTGIGVLYISHHLDEIHKICHRVTVLRDGRQIVTAAVTALDQPAIIDAMVGGAVVTVAEADAAGSADAPVRLRVDHLSVRSHAGLVEDISLTLRAGECLGLVGLRGSGNATVADVVAGLVKPDAGTVLVDDAPPRKSDADASCTNGVGYVPEDRHARGFIGLMGVDENLTLPILASLSRLGIISPRRRGAIASDLRARLSIVASTGRQPVGELSGGNQQKVVVGRALASEPAVLVIVSPTTGVDVASKAVLLAVIDDARRDGMAVLLVSDDIEELRIATRLMVMVRGRVVREFRERPWNESDAIATAEGLVE